MSPLEVGPSASVDVESLGASKMLREIAARGEDMRPPLNRVKLLLIAGHRSNFSSEGGYFGTPWQDLSPETLIRKGREGIPSLMSTLVAEGELEEAVSGGTGSRSRVSRGSVSVGVSRRLFKILFAQGGASGARRGVEPKRTVLGISQTERELSLGILDRYLLGK